MRHTQLVNYTLYQIGWFACVLGASQRPWTGCLTGMILVGVHVALSWNACSKSGLWWSPPPLERPWK